MTDTNCGTVAITRQGPRRSTCLLPFTKGGQRHSEQQGAHDIDQRSHEYPGRKVSQAKAARRISGSADQYSGKPASHFEMDRCNRQQKYQTGGRKQKDKRPYCRRASPPGGPPCWFRHKAAIAGEIGAIHPEIRDPIEKSRGRRPVAYRPIL